MYLQKKCCYLSKWEKGTGKLDVLHSTVYEVHDLKTTVGQKRPELATQMLKEESKVQERYRRGSTSSPPVSKEWFDVYCLYMYTREGILHIHIHIYIHICISADSQSPCHRLMFQLIIRFS